MRTMDRSMTRTPLSRAFRPLVAAMLFALTLLGSPVDGAERSRPLTPEQRRDLWERMTPQQREQWRNARVPEQRDPMKQRLSPEQREQIRSQTTPDERQALRQRLLERQQNRGAPNGPENAQSRRLTPEERQRLREQIEQAREMYRRGNPGNRGPNK
ncbi:MAG: hypothetical protein ABJA83_04325 [Burkholderiaceae bacterium]